METFIATFISSYLLLAIVVSAGFGLLAGWLAKQRGRSAGTYFAISFFFSFLIAIIVLLALPNLNTISTSTQASPEGLEKCPHCAEMIKPEARACRFCQRDVSEEFEARRESQAKSERLAEKNRIALAKKNQAAEELLAAERAERERQRRARTRVLLRSPKILGTGALGIIAVTALIVSGMVSQANADAEKKTLAQEEHAQAVHLALAKYSEFMSHSNWTKTLNSCKKRFPSSDLISASGSASGHTIKVSFRFTAGGDGVWLPSQSLKKNLDCFKSYYPDTGASLSDPFSYAPLDARFGNVVSWTGKWQGRIYFTGQVRDLTGGDFSGKGPFEVTLTKDPNYAQNVKAHYLEFLLSTK